MPSHRDNGDRFAIAVVALCLLASLTGLILIATNRWPT